jgi:hypothetical protein
MMIRFLGPFEALAEKEATISIPEPIPLRALVGLIASRYTGMARYAEIATDADLSAHLIFFRDGKLLRLSDPVRDGDLVQVLLPATGG